jgi:hypothetical protein
MAGRRTVADRPAEALGTVLGTTELPRMGRVGRRTPRCSRCARAAAISHHYDAFDVQALPPEVEQRLAVPPGEAA